MQMKNKTLELGLSAFILLCSLSCAHRIPEETVLGKNEEADKKVISPILTDRSDDFLMCYNRSVASNNEQDISKTLGANFHISLNQAGKIANLTISLNSDKKWPGLINCLETEMKETTFPRSTRNLTIIYDMIFRTSEGFRLEVR